MPFAGYLLLASIPCLTNSFLPLTPLHTSLASDNMADHFKVCWQTSNVVLSAHLASTLLEMPIYTFANSRLRCPDDHGLIVASLNCQYKMYAAPAPTPFLFASCSSMMKHTINSQFSLEWRINLLSRQIYVGISSLDV